MTAREGRHQHTKYQGRKRTSKSKGGSSYFARSGRPPGAWPPFAAATPLYARFSSSTSRFTLSSLSLGSEWGRLVPGYETAGPGEGRSSPAEAQSRKLMRYEKDGPTAGRIVLDVPSQLLAAAIRGRRGGRLGLVVRVASRAQPLLPKRQRLPPYSFSSTGSASQARSKRESQQVRRPSLLE